MEKKPKNNKNFWLYGAFASLVVAIIGLVLVLFVFNDEKKHKADDDEDDDDIEQVDEERNNWYDKDDIDERESKSALENQDDTQILPEEEVVNSEIPYPNHCDESIYDVLEQMPQFLDGDVRVWLGEHIQYPDEAQNHGLHGTVVCQFIVEKDGSIDDVTVIRSVDPLLDKEAVRVIESMPKWAPGKKDGEPVRVKYTLPITFTLQ